MFIYICPNFKSEENIINMYKYKNGDSVSYDMGILKGNAIVVGVSSTPLPWLGATYILKDPKMDTDSYPYECFACPENMISDRNTSEQNASR